MVKAWKGKNKQKENVYLGIQVREQYILGQSLGRSRKRKGIKGYKRKECRKKRD